MHVSRRPVAWALAALGALLASERDAGAYVRAVTRLGCHPVHWDQTDIVVASDSGVLSDLGPADVERIVGEALESWRAPLRGKSFLQLEQRRAAAPLEVAPDGVQRIEFRTGTWCRPAESPDGEPLCYDHSATALTTLTYVVDADDEKADGRITDAEIELNAVDSYFYDADAVRDPPITNRRPTDLWNTLSHELGHVLGLEEACSLGGLPACVRDGDGQPVLACRAVEDGRAGDPKLQAIYDSTMYALAGPRETRKRHPSSDDVAGVVAGSPLSLAPKNCSTTAEAPAAAPTGESGGGCTLSHRAARAWPVGALAILAVFACRWRRRRMDHRTVAAARPH